MFHRRFPKHICCCLHSRCLRGRASAYRYCGATDVISSQLNTQNMSRDVSCVLSWLLITTATDSTCCRRPLCVAPRGGVMIDVPFAYMDHCYPLVLLVLSLHASELSAYK